MVSNCIKVFIKGFFESSITVQELDLQKTPDSFTSKHLIKIDQFQAKRNWRKKQMYHQRDLPF